MKLTSFAEVELSLAGFTHAESAPDLRAELQARLTLLPPEERVVLLQWYGDGDRPQVIADRLSRSVRYVYRLRRSAIEQIIDLGREEFADAFGTSHSPSAGLSLASSDSKGI